MSTRTDNDSDIFADDEKSNDDGLISQVLWRLLLQALLRMMRKST